MSQQAIRVAVLSRSRIVRAGVVALVGLLGDQALVVHASAAPDVVAELGSQGEVDVAVVDRASGLATALGVPVVSLEYDEARVAGSPAVSLDTGPAELLAALRARAAPPRTEQLRLPAGLSPRELSVISLIGAGRSNVEIAAQLFVSENTVKTYIRTAYRKLDVATRSHALLWALEHGLVPVGRD